MSKNRIFTFARNFISLVSVLGLALLSLSIKGAPLPEPSPDLSAAPELIMVSPEPPPTTTPEPTPEPTPLFYEISLIGDNTLASNHYSKGASNSYENVVGDNYAYPYELTKQFFENDDCTIVNLECVLSEYNVPDMKAFTFRANPSYVEILKLGGVDFASLGNNHVLDYGNKGYEDTKAILEEAGIGYAGRDEWSIYETESGLKIGIYAVSFGEIYQIQNGIAALKESGAEFIIAALHWGTEGAYRSNRTQQNQGRAAIDAGADFVMGTHPHTLQDIEEYNGKYIYYSLGNWSFGGNSSPRDKDTVVLKLSVMRDIDGTISVIERQHIPCAISGSTTGNNYQPIPYEEGSEDWSRVISKLEGTFKGSNLTVSYSYAAEG